MILKSAETAIAATFVAAADTYSGHPMALQLRAMNIIYETTKERGAGCMSLFALEHSKVAYRLDLAFFGAASVGLGALLFLAGPPTRLIQSIVCAALGLASWTFIEYGVHRFILHGMKPFSAWHARHHRQPMARIYSPTFVSVILIAALIYVPAWIAWGRWPACALTFGVVSGDFGYALTHHAVHQCGAERGGWLWRRRRWHGLHHAALYGPAGRPGYYGVTSPFWDCVFRTARD